MKKIRSIVCAFIVLISCFAICFAFAACSDEEEEDTRYEVAIRLKCSDGTIYEFPVGTDDLYDEIVYDETERTYEVTKYKMVGYSDLWIDTMPSHFEDRFYINILYGDGDRWYNEVDSITISGAYCVCIDSNYSSSIIKYRSCRLYVTII